MSPAVRRNFAIRPDVLGPQKPRDELIWLHTQLFEVEQMLEGSLLFGRNIPASSMNLISPPASV